MTQRPSFRGEDWRSAHLEDVDLSGATVRLGSLAGAHVRNTSFEGARLRGVILCDAEIDGDITGLRINGVEVAPLIEAELDRQQPDRRLLGASEPESLRDAWDRLAELWQRTEARAIALEERAPGSIHERVDEEWSFVETPRHLVFATDAWLRRALLGEIDAFHPLVVPHDEERDNPGLPWDPEARPTLDEVLAVRRDRQGQVRAFLADVTPGQLARSTTPLDLPGYPPPGAYHVLHVLRGLVNEEWHHRLFAERDLAVLEGRLTHD